MAIVSTKIRTRGNGMAILAAWLGLTQESNNHRDSGTLVHVAKSRNFGLFTFTGSGDKGQGPEGGKRKLSTFQKRLELSQLDGEAPLVPSVGISCIMTDHLT